MNTSKKISAKSTCYHCGETCADKQIHIEEKTFCCEGCKLVFEILDENNLCTYYNLSESPGIKAKGKFVSEKFAYLDDEKVKQRLISFTDTKQTQVILYLPQMHCSSCIWLLENLHKINPEIIRSQVDFPKKEITVFYNEEGITLRKLVELLAFIGYEPFISFNDLEIKKKTKPNYKQLLKIGIAGFCFGNVMMLSFPEYFSVGNIQEPGLKLLFSYLNLLISLPAFFYCASEFFTSAWKGLRQKFLNIDAPIALAILITFSRSVYEIISQTGAGYLDSMCGIIFFMLLGRFFQNKTYDTLSFERDYKSYFPVSVTLNKNGKETAVPISSIKIGDRIIIRNNELIPADAILFRGEAIVDYSFVTGESSPVEKIIGEIIYAGGKQMGTQIELEIIKDVSQSYLTQLWNNDTFKKTKDDSKSYIHKVSKYFTFILFALAVGGFVFWYFANDMHRALNALTSVLIVACPCALLLSATFTNGNILRIFGKNKFYLKNSDVIEKLSTIDTVVFDKTGTITDSGEIEIEYEGKHLDTYQKQLIRSAVVNSTHPLSKRIIEVLPASETLFIRGYKEIAGKGIEATVDGKKIKIGSYAFVYNQPQPITDTTSSCVYIKIGENVLGNFIMKNAYRSGLNILVNSLKKKYNLFILSGDNEGEKKFLKKIFVKANTLYFNQSPSDKLNFIKKLQNKNCKVAMIGDGLNDAGALKQSDVGIAISDDINNFSPACDAIIDGSKFIELKKYFDYAKAGKRIIIGSFILSLLYNIVGLSYAVSGTLSPVIAAILMPISSISIVLFTVGMSSLSAKQIQCCKQLGDAKNDINHNQL